MRADAFVQPVGDWTRSGYAKCLPTMREKNFFENAPIACSGFVANYPNASVNSRMICVVGRLSRLSLVSSAKSAPAAEGRCAGEIMMPRERSSSGSAEILDPPREYPKYSPLYYAAYVTDPDGIKLEVAHLPDYVPDSPSAT